MRSTRLVTIGCALALSLVLSACGDDDGEAVRDIGSEDGGSASGASGSGSASGVASGEASPSGSASGSGAAAAEKDCQPVGEDLEGSADETVEVDLVDYAFDPPSITVAPGVVTFAATNEGDEAHELAFLPGGGEVPLDADGNPDEAALEEMGAFELEAFGPGQTCNATYELEAGDYTMFCIVETAEGETHASLGMVGSLSVG